jgi:hypothetical protein
MRYIMTITDDYRISHFNEWLQVSYRYYNAWNLTKYTSALEHIFVSHNLMFLFK